MKKILVFFLLLTAFFVCSQEQKDSISFYLNNAKGIRKLSYLKKAVILSNDLKKDSLLKKTSIAYGKQSYFSKDTLGLTFSKNKLLKHYGIKKDSFSLAKAYHFAALNHKIKNNLDSTFYYYHKSKNISVALKDSAEIGRRLLSMAIIQVKELDFLGCEITTVEGLKYVEPLKKYRVLISLYQTLGNALASLKRPKEARAYYHKAQNIAKYNKIKRKREKNYLNLLNNIGMTYKDQGNYKKAVSLFEQGLRTDSLEIKYPKNYQSFLGNLSSIYFLQGDTKKAIKGYKIVLEGRKKLKNAYSESFSHAFLSEAYLKNKNDALAKKHANIGLKLARKTRNNKIVLECLKLLSDLNKGQEAKKYLEEYIQLNDSLFEKERRLKNQFAKIRYETDKKEKENTVLKTENKSKQLEIVYHKQQRTIGRLVAATGLLLFMSSVLFYFYRKRKLLYQAQLERITAREDERQQIAKSLHDEVAGDLRLLHQKLKKSNLLDEAQKLDDVKENVRNLSHQLSSVSFGKVSFKDQIINLVSDYFELNFRITVTGLQENNWEALNDAINRLLYLSIRETIQNCKKHAKASKVIITFVMHKNHVFLQMEDNGIGFDAKINKKGIGLQNLQERIEELNGTLDIKSEVGVGTLTTIQIPLNAWTNKNTLS
ncbi:tetratricopeptide repeat-containing sensor histidine kinase [Tenacibaculum piscium]|uniref:tetratricopeptide repeat-containing sensor histidine kinase n=1 Tax=Tenacibaculum piscium TaxID=1458515 RepID=UPI001EFB4892|nr:tetratricopeptide repeat protein [Tenacibaculum piscium]MCG8183131.1 tetratricopeptide repeat protein [Tenacibaculum piscium]MCG8204685.1 tetratricopeptide repeat protein [Tenacibaculum piscium]